MISLTPFLQSSCVFILPKSFSPLEMLQNPPSLLPAVAADADAVVDAVINAVVDADVGLPSNCLSLIIFDDFTNCLRLFKDEIVLNEFI